MKYLKLALKSVKELKKNPALLYPNLALLATTIGLSLIFLYINGLLPYLLKDPSIIFGSNTQNVDNIRQFVLTIFQDSNKIIKMVISFIVFFATNFFVGAGLMSMKYGMMREIVKGERVTLKEGMKLGAKNYLRVIELRVFVFLFMFLLIILISSILLVLTSFSSSIILILASLASLIVLFVRIILLFRYPIMFIEKKRAITTIKDTFLFFTKHFHFVILTWIVIFVVLILFNIILFPINFLVSNLLELAFSLPLVLVITYLIKQFIGFIVDVWSDLYIFFSYVKSKER
jgi:MFS family permease